MTSAIICVNAMNWVSQRGRAASGTVMIPLGKYLPVPTLTRCHNDSLCVRSVFSVQIPRRVCVAAEIPPLYFPAPPQHSLFTAAARQSLINNVSFLLKSGLTLAAFCLLPGARVRMYRLEKQGAPKIPPLEAKEFPSVPPHSGILIKSLMNHIFIAFLS